MPVRYKPDMFFYSGKYDGALFLLPFFRKINDAEMIRRTSGQRSTDCSHSSRVKFAPTRPVEANVAVVHCEEDEAPLQSAQP